ncbi:hypothetical protein FQA39_LY19129 [Lamprigera yunnana]|nr:hypothetical protein FQA39_LY19129 [Lamprigera yunnana]
MVHPRVRPFHCFGVFMFARISAAATRSAPSQPQARVGAGQHALRAIALAAAGVVAHSYALAQTTAAEADNAAATAVENLPNRATSTRATSTWQADQERCAGPADLRPEIQAPGRPFHRRLQRSRHTLGHRQADAHAQQGPRPGAGSGPHPARPLLHGGQDGQPQRQLFGLCAQPFCDLHTAWGFGTPTLPAARRSRQPCPPDESEEHRVQQHARHADWRAQPEHAGPDLQARRPERQAATVRVEPISTLKRYQWALFAENEWRATDAIALTTGLAQ